MRVKISTYPLLKIVTTVCLISSISAVQFASAEDISLPLQRTIASQPITQLEIVSTVKNLLNGQILSIKKQSSYSNPDCHQVKFLEEKGELQIIKLACFTEKLAQKKRQ